jgi:hypothetical protein
VFTRRDHIGCAKRTERGLWCVSRTLLGCAFAAALFSGCGSGGPERAIVSGTVTYNGKPVPKATIRFVPVQTSSVRVTGAWVTDGAYKVDGDGGVPVGIYKIEIEAYSNVETPNPSRSGKTSSLHAAEEGLRQYIPAKYNAKTQLEITIQPGSRSVTKNFELSD